MLKERGRILAATIFVADLALVGAAFLAAYWLRDSVAPRLAPGLFPTRLYPLASYLPLLPIVLVIWGVLLLSSGRYRSHRTVPLLKEAWGMVRVCLLGGVVFVLVLYASRLDERLLDGDQLSRLWIVLFATLSCLFLLTEKLALRLTAHQVRARGYNYRTVLIVGTNPTAEALAESIQAHRWWGFKIAGLIAKDAAAAESYAGAYPVLGTVAEIPSIVEHNVVDDIIIAAGRWDLGHMEDVFFTLQEQGIRTRFAFDFLPHIRAKVRLEELDGLPLLTFSTGPTSQVQLLIKRLLDIAISSLLLVLALPVILVIATLIKLTSGGRVLFRQTRCGLNGRLFTLYKFRTMVEDAEVRRRSLQELNEMSGPVFKSRHDPRVTPLGRFLRKFSLDELPQLWNVLLGQMSLVGPRPAIPEEVAHYQRWQRRRLSMKPGITCLWQVSGRNEVDFDRWMELDLEYIDAWTPLLDVQILAKTIPVVLSGKGAS